MALLNYSSAFLQSGTQGLSGFVNGISQYLTATSGSADWLKIFVSPDAAGGGHFITHGIDFGRTYDGSRGLVPANTAADLTKTFLRGDGWKALWSQADQTAAAGSGTAAQQAANIESYLQSTLVSAYDIKQWIANSFAANDAMRFKGTISVAQNDSISYNDGSNHNNFPTSCEVGDTYKVTGTTNKTLAGQNVNSGDMLICIKDGSGNNLNTAEYWTVVESNIEHIITYTLNGTAFYLYSTGNSPITLFAPTTSGTSGQILVSGGANTAPSWAAPSTITVGEANKVTNALTKGSGLSFKNQGVEQSSYDGSQAITIALLPATTASIGGIKVDDGTNGEAYNSNSPTDLKPTITVDGNGQLYLTKQNIINALGFTPGNAFGQVTGIVVASAANAYSNTTSATANPYINIIDGANTVLGSYQAKGSGKITVSSVANAAGITVSLGEADSSNYGGIKIGYTAPSGSPKNYAVQLDTNGKAYVAVPWISDIFTTTADGLVPMASTANKQTNNADNVLTNSTFVLGADAKWYKLPASAFVGTWRNIKVNGTEILSTDVTSGALDLIAGTNITLTAGTGANAGKVTVAASWRDVQVHTISNSTISQDATTIGSNDPLVFENSESIFMLGEEVTSGNVTKTVVKSYITWYNLDTQEYELV